MLGETCPHQRSCVMTLRLSACLLERSQLLSNGTDFQQKTVPEMCNHIYQNLKQEIFFIIHLLGGGFVLIVVHEIKHVLYRYFPPNQLL